MVKGEEDWHIWPHSSSDAREKMNSGNTQEVYRRTIGWVILREKQVEPADSVTS